MHIIAVDTGNRLMKTPHFVFESGIARHGKDLPPVQTDDLIKFEGNYYALDPVRTSYLKDKTEDDTYYILTLFAIAKELVRLGLTGQKQEIALAVGLPLSHLRGYTTRYRDYFLSKGNEVTYQYNGQDISINIRNVTVFPQGFPAAGECLLKVRDVTAAYIVDIGGYTTDIIKLKYGKPVTGYYYSLDEGVIEMINWICEEYNRDTSIDLNQDLIEPILRKTAHEPRTEHSKKLYQYVQNKADEYARRLAKKLIEKKISKTDDNTLIFVGGGSELFRSVFESCFDSTIFNTDVHANAIGYAKYLSRMLGVPYED